MLQALYSGLTQESDNFQEHRQGFRLAQQEAPTRSRGLLWLLGAGGCFLAAAPLLQLLLATCTGLPPFAPLPLHRLIHSQNNLSMWILNCESFHISRFEQYVHANCALLCPWRIFSKGMILDFLYLEPAQILTLRLFVLPKKLYHLGSFNCFGIILLTKFFFFHSFGACRYKSIETIGRVTNIML